MIFTSEELVAQKATLEHILEVQKLIGVIVKELVKRGEEHDKSKLSGIELANSAVWTPKLGGIVYGSPEHAASRMKQMDALAIHYAVNRHHPEHFINGIAGMNLVDIVEMFCDWKAALSRYKGGDLRDSIAINAKKFNIPAELASIFENTVSILEGDKCA